VPLAASLVPFFLGGAGVLVIAIAALADRLGGGPRRQERRNSPRTESATTVVVHRGERADPTFAIDRSDGGILLFGPPDLEPGATVELEIGDSRLRATVLRVSPQGYRALRLD
jgi:PilZ domain-containing protein